jgi:hypothetical protein
MKGILLHDIVRHFGIICESELQVADYQVDSRMIQVGDLFSALEGKRNDSYAFLVRGGSKGTAVSKGFRRCLEGLFYWGVERGMSTGSLHELARHAIAPFPLFASVVLPWNKRKIRIYSLNCFCLMIFFVVSQKL